MNGTVNQNDRHQRAGDGVSPAASFGWRSPGSCQAEGMSWIKL